MSRKNAGRFILAILVVAACSPALAQQQGGDNEFQIFGSYILEPEDAGLASVSYGHFFGKWVRVGGALSVTFADTSTGFLFGEVEFDFTSAKVVPFIVLGAGLSVGIDEEAGGNYSVAKGEAGAKFYFSDKVAFRVSYLYQDNLEDQELQFDSGFGVTTTTIDPEPTESINFGLSFLFG